MTKNDLDAGGSSAPRRDRARPAGAGGRGYPARPPSWGGSRSRPGRCHAKSRPHAGGGGAVPVPHSNPSPPSAQGGDAARRGAGPGRSSAPEGTGERGREGRASGCRSVTLPGGGGRCRAVPAAEARRDGVKRGGKERGGGRRRGWAGAVWALTAVSPPQAGAGAAGPRPSPQAGRGYARAALPPALGPGRGGGGPGGGAASGCGARCGSTRWWCWAAGGWGSPP